jgi:hypothetical protein
VKLANIHRAGLLLALPATAVACMKPDGWSTSATAAGFVFTIELVRSATEIEDVA